MRQLPSLNALKAFDASARHLSFTKAATELGVSQGAVSRQVQNLEQYFNTTLFKRLYHQLELSTAGQQLAANIIDSFDALERSTRLIDQRNTPNITLNIDGQITFTQRWLVPRLTKFCAAHPHIIPNITVGDGPIDFAVSEADVALRVAYEEEAKPNTYTQHQLLYKEQKIAVCSPSLFKEYQKIGLQAFLQKTPKLQHLTAKNYWKEIMLHRNIADITPDHGPGLEHVFLLAEAAKSSLGIAVLPDFMIQQEINDGLLIPFLLDNNGSLQRFITGRAYYLQHSRTKEFHPAVKVFKRWIMAEAAAE